MKVDFFIVGAPKAGTTSLYHYLSEHPETDMSILKEPNYFSEKSIKDNDLYYKSYPIKKLSRYHSLFKNNNLIKGEASVSYLYYKDVAKSIKAYNSSARIIIMLRDPIERAFSHYLMDFRLGLINDTFENIIFQKSNLSNSKTYFQQYVKLGEYTNQIKRYFNEFPSEQILVVDYDDFKNKTSDVVKKVYKFLKIDINFSPELNNKHNARFIVNNRLLKFLFSKIIIRKAMNLIFPKFIKSFIKNQFFNNKPPILLSSSRLYLQQYFKKDVENLSNFLQKDYSKWIK
ncbi:MAG: hypothetical protein CMP73_00935 [Flavobacteriales bacterium]|nr:hypothetical protein [Flavobacteriales bacterium]|tara:strand:+ start:10756 stop:11616 length:861 start_codon:yes stop_codon:yes gene_type:complete